VRFGGVAAPVQQFVSHNLLVCEVPNLAPGWHTAEIISASNGTVRAALPRALEVVPGGTPALRTSPPPDEPLAAPRTTDIAWGGPTMIMGFMHMAAGTQDARGGHVGVQLFSGETDVGAVDLIIPGRGLDFIWARRYRSRSGPDTAIGRHWDFSYNIWIEPGPADDDDRPSVRLHDGNGRDDLYWPQPDGTYAADGFFRTGTLSNDVFTLRFADTGRWEFNPLDGSPAAGKIARSVDRNDNRLEFSYDAQGRLVRVRDTLDRDVNVAYTTNGLLQSVTDFAGRTVRYGYDDAGNLVAATSPAVTNTPNGNDFPGGKTNRYGYVQGIGPGAPPGLLASITDAKGQTAHRFIYRLDQAQFDYLRCIAEQRGASNEVLRYTYLPQTPAPSNGFAVLKTIVNDRVGNVREHLFDARNREVIRREFTGRSVPGPPVTELANRPVTPWHTKVADMSSRTGPGPGGVFGPHVRGFGAAGLLMADVNYDLGGSGGSVVLNASRDFAYGTLKYGVSVGNNFAYGTLKYGVSVGNNFAYGTLKYGVIVGDAFLDQSFVFRMQASVPQQIGFADAYKVR